MHGTGTQAGDFEEMTSVLNTFAKKRRKDNPLTLGTVKAAVGHSEGAAGSLAVMKVLKMMEHNVIPPQPGWPFKVNHQFPDLEPLNVRLATKPRALWPASDQSREVNILVNGFDASGGESCLAIRTPPIRPPVSQDPRTSHIVTISAKTLTSLKANHHTLYKFLVAHPRTELSHLAYTTTARRMHEPLRCAYVASSIEDLLAQLDSKIKEMDISLTRTRPKPPSCVFLFTGQGSQYSAMGMELFKSHDGFRDLLHMYDRIAQSLQLPTFIEVIANESGDISQYPTTIVQLAMVALEIAMATTMKEWGVYPTAVVGHSLGEYAALCIAGVLSVNDALYLVGHRAALIERHLVPNTHAMLVTSLDPESLDECIKRLGLKGCAIACKNGPHNTVASGPVGEINALKVHLQTEDHRTSILRTAYGFHSAQIEPILDKLKILASHVKISKPVIPFVSTLTGQVERHAESFDGSYFARQAREPVNFSGAMECLRDSVLGAENCLWVELGPSPVLLGLTNSILKIPAANLLPTMRPNESNWLSISRALKAGYEAGLGIRWPRFHKYHVHCLRLLSLPTYSFDYQDFHVPWRDSVDVFAPIQAVESDLSNGTAKKSSLPQFRSTTSVQQLETLEVHAEQIVAEFKSSLKDSKLLSAIQGHIVDGTVICPMSILVDMAFTAAQYAYRVLHLTPDAPQMGLCDINMSSAIVLRPEVPPQDVGISIIYRPKTNDAVATFSSVPGLGDRPKELHGTCRVTFNASVSSLGISSSTTLLLKSRIERLQMEAATGKAHRLLKPVVYSLFNQAVVYGEDYQGMQEVIIDPQCRDAVAEVKLHQSSHGGEYNFDPYWTDTLTHLGGFVLNSGLKFPKEFICMAIGFDTWRSTTTLAAGDTCTAYTTFREGEKSTIIVDCYIFQHGELAHELLGLRFQKMTKVVFRTLFGAGHDSTSAHHYSTSGTAYTLEKANPHTNGSKTIPRDLSQASNHFSPLTSDRSNSSSTDRIRTDGRHPRQQPPTLSKDFSNLLSIVARETGARLTDMSDDTSFADLGVDSLMAISIIATHKKENNISLPAAFFMQQDSVGAAKAALGIQPASLTPPPSESEGTLTPEITPSKQRVEVELSQQLHPVRTINIQHSRSECARNLFLLADESGSALSYINLGFLGPDIRAQGIELQLDLKLNLESYFPNMALLVESYASMIKAQQGDGPYLLGGIGTGAIFALEVARNLLEDLRQVSGLLLVDPRCQSALQLRETYRQRTVNSPRQISQTHRAELLRKSLAGYSPQAFSGSSPEKTIVLLPKSGTRMPESVVAESTDWKRIIPGCECRREDFQSGSPTSFFKVSCGFVSSQDGLTCTCDS